MSTEPAISMNHFPKYSVQNASQHNGFRVKWLGQIPGPRQRSKQSLLRVQFQFSRHQRAAINRQTLCVQCQAMMTQHVQNDPVRIEMFYMSFISRSALKKIHPKRQNVKQKCWISNRPRMFASPSQFGRKML